jgi:predicted nucleic acid-binding protein
MPAELRDDHLDGRVVVYAPSIVLLEVASALRRYVARRLLTENQALKALQLIEDAGLSLEPIDASLALEALHSAPEYGVTPHGAAYMVVA